MTEVFPYQCWYMKLKTNRTFREVYILLQLTRPDNTNFTENSNTSRAYTDTETDRQTDKHTHTQRGIRWKNNNRTVHTPQAYIQVLNYRFFKQFSVSVSLKLGEHVEPAIALTVYDHAKLDRCCVKDSPQKWRHRGFFKHRLRSRQSLQC